VTQHPAYLRRGQLHWACTGFSEHESVVSPRTFYAKPSGIWTLCPSCAGTSSSTSVPVRLDLSRDDEDRIRHMLHDESVSEWAANLPWPNLPPLYVRMAFDAGIKQADVLEFVRERSRAYAQRIDADPSRSHTIFGEFKLPSRRVLAFLTSPKAEFCP
jgi:hypothetical protein